jgi:hypothetical protein
MDTAAKNSALFALARRRQMDTSDGHSRKYLLFRDFDCNCDHCVSQTISAYDVAADLMLIAQDWTSDF